MEMLHLHQEASLETKDMKWKSPVTLQHVKSAHKKLEDTCVRKKKKKQGQDKGITASSADLEDSDKEHVLLET